MGLIVRFLMIELLVWEFKVPREQGWVIGSWRGEGSRGLSKAVPQGCPRAGTHRPGVSEGHAQGAIGQRQVRRWRPRLLGVDEPARTQRRAQGARRFGGPLGDPWLQADPKEEAAGTLGTAGGPRSPWARSCPERVDLQLEDARRPCLGRKEAQGEGTRKEAQASSPGLPPRTHSHCH